MKQPLTNKFLYRVVNCLYNKAVVDKRVDLTVGGDDISNLRAPFVVLVNHTSPNDVFVCARLLKRFCPNYLCAIDQIARNRVYFRCFGAVPKRQFVSEISSVRACKYVLSKRRPLVIFPEGKLSVDGRTGMIPFSTAKLVKNFGVDVFTICIHGNYLGKPRWSGEQVKTKVFADVRRLFCAEQAKELSLEEIYEKICGALSYDEFLYQKSENLTVIRSASGLENIVYRCPKCGAEFGFFADGNKLVCKCGAAFDVNGCRVGEYNIGDLVEAQRQAVRRELIDGNYLFQAEADVFELPNISGYKPLGRGKIVFDKRGMRVTTAERELFFAPNTAPTLAFDGGKRFFVSVVGNTYRFEVFGEKAKEIAKVCLAVEENFKLFNRLNTDIKKITQR